MNEEKDTKIDYRFKFLYAVAIIMVVANHVYGGGVSLFYEIFPAYGFHVALFAFVSGYFYKKCVEERPSRFFCKKVSTLLIPYFIWNFAYGIIAQLMNIRGFTMGVGVSLRKLILDPFLDGYQFSYNGPAWFVISLFFAEMIYMLLRKGFFFLKGNLKEYVITILCLVSGVIPVYFCKIDHRTGIYVMIGRALYLLVFYAIGQFYKNYLEKKDTLPNWLYFTIVIGVELVITLIKGYSPTYGAVWLYLDDYAFMPYLIGVLGIAFWLRIARIVEPIVRDSKVILLLADHTYSIVVNHFLGFMLVKAFYATLWRYTNSLCQDFDWYMYHYQVEYFYQPKGLEVFRILYVVVAIAFSVVVGVLLRKLKEYTLKKVTDRWMRVVMVTAILLVFAIIGIALTEYLGFRDCPDLESVKTIL